MSDHCEPSSARPPLVRISCVCAPRVHQVQTALEDRGFEILMGPPERGHVDGEDVHLFLENVLTEKETAVLQYVADSSSAEGIGKTLGVSPQTVRRHLANVRRKTCVETTVQAVAWGLRHGVIH